MVRVGENERGLDKSYMGKKIARRLENVRGRQTGGGEEMGDVSSSGGGGGDSGGGGGDSGAAERESLSRQRQ
jgi:hypothetical protein